MIRCPASVRLAGVILWFAVAGSAAGRADVADAVMKGDLVALRDLLRQKADVNATQIDGSTALHWAVFRDRVDMAGFLIDAGAKVDVKNREEITPLNMASLYGNTAMIESLLAGGADAKQKGPHGETM